VFTNTVSGGYWSSSNLVSVSYRWFVSFENGGNYGISSPSITPLNVRCVRGGQFENFDNLKDLQTSGFERNTIAEIVTDTKNGLQWQDNSEVKTITKTQKEAGTYCSNLSLSGYEDWRMPSIEELITVVDTNRAYPAINSMFTNTSGANFYWTSTIDENNSSSAWAFHFFDGSAYILDKNHSYYVRCVRGAEPSNNLIDLIYKEGIGMFTLSGSGSENFNIDSNGTIYLLNNIGFETNATYNLTVYATITPPIN
jgi:hypothetical protein